MSTLKYVSCQQRALGSTALFLKPLRKLSREAKIWSVPRKNKLSAVKELILRVESGLEFLIRGQLPDSGVAWRIFEIPLSLTPRVAG